MKYLQWLGLLAATAFVSGPTLAQEAEGLKTVVPVRAPGPFPVQFLATRSDVTFYTVSRREYVGAGQLGGAWVGTLTNDVYHELCRAPCVETLRRGTYSLSLAISSSDPVLVDNLLRVESPLTVRAHYEERTGFRTAGWLVLAGSIVAGGVLSTLSVLDCPPEDTACSIPRVPLLVSGLALGAVGTIVGLLMASKDDDAVVDVEVWERK